MKNLNSCLEKYIKSENVHNIAVRVGIKNKIYCDIYCYDKKKIDDTTLFDMASVTKIMVTSTLALIAVDNKILKIDDYVSKFYSVPEDKNCLKIKNLLTHTMGIGYKVLDKEGINYNNVQNYILNMPCDVKIGTEVLYSCPGFILLGKILEKVFDNSLDELFLKYVAVPLELTNTSFLPSKDNAFVNSNLLENERGMVNDYNCRFLGGVAGNAGVFSNMRDICKYVEMLNSYGKPLIKRETFEIAVKNYTRTMQESRGLGFLYVDKKYNQTGDLFTEGSIGHCGHTI